MIFAQSSGPPNARMVEHKKQCVGLSFVKQGYCFRDNQRKGILGKVMSKKSFPFFVVEFHLKFKAMGNLEKRQKMKSLQTKSS